MDPEVQGLSGAEAINQSFNYGGRAGKSSSQVSQALLGEQAGDLRGLIKSSASVFQQLASRESQLSDLVTNSRSRPARSPPSRAASRTRSPSSRRPSSRRSATCRNQRRVPAAARLRPRADPGRQGAAGDDPGGNAVAAPGRQARPGERARRHRRRPPRRDAGALQGTANLSGLLLQLGRSSRCQSQVLTPTGESGHHRRLRDRPVELPRVPLRAAGQAGQGATSTATASSYASSRAAVRCRSAPTSPMGCLDQRQRQLRAGDSRPDRHPAAEALEGAAGADRRSVLQERLRRT